MTPPATGDVVVVVVQLNLQGTQLGPLWLPAGTPPASGNKMDAPCCDVWEIVDDGKIKRAMR